MDTSYDTIAKPASPEYVLALLVDDHRQQCQYDPNADPDTKLTFDTTVDEWRWACDLLPWRQLGRAFNRYWDMNISDQQWREVLEPAKSKTLRDVCELMATRAAEPAIRPISIFGRECAEGGAFLTIRSLLSDAGAKTDLIRPSSNLENYTVKYLNVFLGPISRIAPGALPALQTETPFYDASCRLMLGAIIAFVATACMQSVFPSLFIVAILLLATTWLLHFVAAMKGPKSVRFGDLATFRDMAVLIAGKASCT